MFDTYMDAHALDPRMRRRMTLAAGTAAVACALAVTMYSGVERLSIARVGAPKVELDFLMATTVASPMLAPPPPSPGPAQETATVATDNTPEPEPRERDDVDAFLDPVRKPASSGVPKLGGGNGGVPGVLGVPGVPGIGLPCPGGQCTIGIPNVPRTNPPKEDAKVPLSVVEGRLRFSPDPPREALRATRAGTLGRGGTSVVEFCVGPDGKVDKVSTKRSAGDGDIDRICRDTLRRWRFSPLQVEGRATRMCSEFAFVIAFE